MEFDLLSHRMIGLALQVHSALGPGMLESTYEACLARELERADIPFRGQCPIAINYKGVEIEHANRADLLVDDALLVELKAVERVEPVHRAQTLAYMAWSGIRTGLPINFNCSRLREHIRRLVL